jgi:hypothetical protein
MQIQGTKEWRYSPKPEFPWATIKGAFSSTSHFRWFRPTPNFPTVPMPDQSRLIKRTLTPGDILLIPPGTVHAAQACDECSLSLNLKLQWSSTLEHLLRAVQPRLLPQASWRAPLPFLPLPDEGPYSDHSETRNQISLRLKELAQEILDLAQDPIALQSLWFESLMGSQPEISKQPGHRLVPGSATLRLPRDTHPRLCALIADGEEQLLLFFRTTSFVFSGVHVRKVLERVLALRSFVASELLEDSSDWVQTQVLLTILVRKGILEDVS